MADILIENGGDKLDVLCFGPHPDDSEIGAAGVLLKLAQRGFKCGVVDMTARVEDFLRSARLEAGWVNVQTRHTTTGICVNENEPLLRDDLLALLERLAPRETAYAHDELHRRVGAPPDERPNGHAHAKALLLRTSETLNVARGRLQLGRWQRVLLLELDGPREREVSLLAMGERQK